jgi:hypothetical protein
MGSSRKRKPPNKQDGMAAEMTPRPEIKITDEKELEYVVQQRELFLESIKMEASLVFEAVFEAWRRVHVIRMGKAENYATPADYELALIDPYPYEPEYVFYCLGK